MPHYGVAGDQLVVFSEPPEWSGRVDGRPVLQAIALTGTDDVIVRVDPPEIDDSLKPYSNLFRVDSAGRVVWSADLPLPEDWTDFYVEVEIAEGELKAGSWSCYAMTLDSETGRILSKVFTK